MSSSLWQPVAASERYSSLDLLRGFSLFGVLLINLLYFFRLSLFAHIVATHSHPGWLNHAIDTAAAGLVEFRAFEIFSLTFGIGVAIQAERAIARGVGMELFLVRRFLILLVFGLVHMVFISNVDILTLYAVCGLVAIPLLRLPAAVLVIIAAAAIYFPPWFPHGPALPSHEVLRLHAIEATRVYGQGSFGEELAFRWRETRDLISPLLIGSAQQTLGLMLLGVSVWRFGIIREPQRHRILLWTVCVVAGIAGLAGFSVPLALAYAAAILVWRRSARAEKWTAPVAAAGRMALTNYLTQSIVLAILFYGYGFGLFGRLDQTAGIAIVIPVYMAQLWFSLWWLRRYRFGPFEWVWRSATYGRLQPVQSMATCSTI